MVGHLMITTQSDKNETFLSRIMGEDEPGEPILILGIGSICTALLLSIWAVVTSSSRL